MFHKKVDTDAEIKYLDFCSLYPYVLKNNPYPTDHSEIIRDNFDYTLRNYFGIKCRVTAPKQLYIPVLPVLVNKKLVFPLCINCAKSKSNKCECRDRSFVGTWVSEELKLAIKRGI